jgi:hypothetical protein
MVEYKHEKCTTSAESLLRALNAKGVDMSDLRHCIHEASHALDAKLRGTWSNKAVDDAMRRIGPVRAAASEIFARAIEQIVCAALGVETKSLDYWIGMSCREAAKFGNPFLDYKTALLAAKRRMGTKDAKERASEIMALASRAKSRARHASKER